MTIGLILRTGLAALSLAASEGTPQKPKAQATARKGPIELTFRLYRDTVGLSKTDTPERGDPDILFCQVVLKNVGPKPIFISDPALLGTAQMKGLGASGFGLQVLAPKGTTLLTKWRESEIKPGSPEWDAEESRSKLYEEFRAKGLSDVEAAAQTDAEIRKSESPRESKASWLAPGSSIATPIESIGFYSFSSTGTYTVSAIYDHRAVKGSYASSHPEPWNVRVATPPVRFRVVP